MASLFSGFNYTPPPPVPSKKKVESTSNEVDYNQNPTKLFKRIEERGWAAALSRLERSPNESKIWVVRKAFDGSVTWRRLPIHQACINRPSAKVVLSLLQSFPNSARQVDSDRRLAVHHACANGATLDVVKHLLMAYPDSINAEDIWFKTPLQTLLSLQNPDPDIVSALKKGPQYYRMKVADARSRMKITKGLTPSSNASVLSSSSRTRKLPSYTDTSENDNKSIITGLEDELGKFSERLAASVNQENTLKNKIYELENKYGDIHRIESENHTLKRELERYREDIMSLESTQRQLDIKSEYIRRMEEENQDLKNELNQYRMDLLSFDEIKRSEENLRNQLEDSTSEANERLRDLENKLLSVTDDLREADSRLRELSENSDKDFYSLKRDLQDASEDADVWKRKADQFKHDNDSMIQELEALRALVASHQDVSKKLKSKLEVTSNEKEQIVGEMEQLDKHLFSMESKLKEVTENLEKVEKEKEELQGKTRDLGKIQNDASHAKEELDKMEKQLRDRDQENEDLNQIIRELEHRQTESQLSYNVECQSLSRQIEDLQDDLQRAMKKQLAAEEDKLEIEKKLKEEKRKSDDLESTIESLRRRDRDAFRDVDILQRSIDDKVAEYRTKWIKEQGETQRLKDSNKDVEEKNLQLQQQITGLNSKNKDLAIKVQELQNELDNHEVDSRKLVRETMNIMTEKDRLETNNKELKEAVASLMDKLDEVGIETSHMHQRQLEQKNYELEQLQREHQSLKDAMLQEIEEKEDLEAKVGFLMEEVEKLEEAQNIPKEINAVINVDNKGILSNHDQNEMNMLLAKLEELKEANETLRNLAHKQNDNDEDKSTSSESMIRLEERLNLLEESKDQEIHALADEKIALENVITELKFKLTSYEREIKELTASNQIYANEVKAMKRQTVSEKDKKKQSIRARLMSLEKKAKSPTESSEGRMDVTRRQSADDSSQVSGMTSVFSSTPSPSPSPSRSMMHSPHMDSFETRSQQELGSRFDKHWISQYKMAKKRDLEGLFPSHMTVTGLSLEGTDDDHKSASGIRTRYTSPELVSTLLRQQTHGKSSSGPTKRAVLNTFLRNDDIRNSSPSTTRERILAMLKE